MKFERLYGLIVGAALLINTGDPSKLIKALFFAKKKHS